MAPFSCPEKAETLVFLRIDVNTIYKICLADHQVCRKHSDERGCNTTVQQKQKMLNNLNTGVQTGEGP